MSWLALALVVLLYSLVVGLLFVYGLNFLYLTFLSWRPAPEPAAPAEPTEWPTVTVQLPVYNELYVAGRLIEAVGRLDYPAGRLEIQVLDDSTDETVELVGRAVACLRAQSLDARHICREVRQGFKAGALAEGLCTARGEFLAIFDADFVPQPDFLRRTIPYFLEADARGGLPLAFIQTRWGHINPSSSLLTRLQALSIDAHFMVEQFARSQGGYFFNFNGTAGVWRKAAIQAAGGWTADTLTEDLDLSYRAFLAGWRGLYLRDLATPAELPASFSAYRRQQHRWARGSFECALKHLPQVWRARLPLRLKLEATLHLTGYGVHLLLFGLVLLYPMVLLLSMHYPALLSFFGAALLFNLTAFAPTIFFLSGQAQLGRRWGRRLPLALFLSAAGCGMMLNTVRAAFQAARRQPLGFERTPKFGLVDNGQNWTRQRYQLRLDPLAYGELGLAALNAVTVALALRFGDWMIAVYAGLFLVGLLFTAGMSVGQNWAVQRAMKQSGRTGIHQQAELDGW